MCCYRSEVGFPLISNPERFRKILVEGYMLRAGYSMGMITAQDMQKIMEVMYLAKILGEETEIDIIHWDGPVERQKSGCCSFFKKLTCRYIN
jgi:hypothetical protein